MQKLDAPVGQIAARCTHQGLTPWKPVEFLFAAAILRCGRTWNIPANFFQAINIYKHDVLSIVILFSYLENSQKYITQATPVAEPSMTHGPFDHLSGLRPSILSMLSVIVI